MKINNLKLFFKDNRYFTLLWLSQIFSQITLNMVNFVMATRIYEKTGSTVAVSLIWVFFYLPSIFLGPFSGFFVDIFNRRKLLIITNFIQFFIIIGYLFIGDRIYPIYSLIFLYSLINQFYFPTEAAMIPVLVKPKYLPVANSLFLLTSQSALAIGFGLGGLFMRFFNYNFPIIFTALCLFLATVSVYFLPRVVQKSQKAATSFLHFLQGVKDGYTFIFNRPVIIYPLMICVCLQVFLVVVGVTLPELAVNILHINVADAGPMLILPLGIGALVGVNIVNQLISQKRKKLLVSWGIVMAIAALLSFSYLVGYFGTYRLWVSLPIMFALGASIVFIFIPNQILIQSNTPDEYRGRVFGALGFIGNLATLPFLLFLATIVELLGLKIFFTIIAGMLIAFYLVLNRLEIYLMRGLFRKLVAK